MHGFACRTSVPGDLATKVLLAVAAFALLSVLAIAAPARADTVTDWDQIAAAALQSPGTATPPGAGQGAPSIAHLAMVHAAVYDAVNAIDGCHEPFVSSPAAKRWYSQDAAVAAAAHHVLVNGGLGIPAARLTAINTAYQAALDAIPAGRAKAGGIATGRGRSGRAAGGTRRRRALRAVPLRGRHAARRVAADSGRQRPLGVAEGRPPVRAPRPRPVRPRPPHRLRSRAYAADFNEVKAVGSAGAWSARPTRRPRRSTGA